MREKSAVIFSFSFFKVSGSTERNKRNFSTISATTFLFDIRYQVRQTGAGSLPSRTHNLLIAAPKNSFSKQIKRLQNNFDDDDDDKAIT